MSQTQRMPREAEAEEENIERRAPAAEAEEEDDGPSSISIIIPWWKQRRKRLRIATLLVFAFVVAISLSAAFSPNNNHDDDDDGDDDDDDAARSAEDSIMVSSSRPPSPSFSNNNIIATPNDKQTISAATFRSQPPCGAPSPSTVTTTTTTLENNCYYRIDIAVSFEWQPSFAYTLWEVERVILVLPPTVDDEEEEESDDSSSVYDGGGSSDAAVDKELVRSYTFPLCGARHVESVCLQQGETYDFTIYDPYNEHPLVGGYNLTSENGTVIIAEGGEIEEEGFESVVFTIPTTTTTTTKITATSPLSDGSTDAEQHGPSSSSLFPSSSSPTASATISTAVAPSSQSKLFPSSSPTAAASSCTGEIVADAQRVELSSLRNPYRPKVAVDGSNMVVAAQEGDIDDGAIIIFVAFYSLDNNGTWQRTNDIQEDCNDYLGAPSSIALSGNTAMLGFETANDNAGTAIVYEHNQVLGIWERIDDAFVHNDDANGGAATHEYFGWHLEVNDNLACVLDGDNANLYHRQESNDDNKNNGSNKWVQFDRINFGWVLDCTISGNTIALWVGEPDRNSPLLQLFAYNPDGEGAVVPIQDAIPTGWFGTFQLGRNSLVYWDWNERIAFVYHREEEKHSFDFVRQFQLNVIGSGHDRVALDGDILVIGGADSVHIFSAHYGGYWEEVSTLHYHGVFLTDDYESYGNYQLAGQSLVVTKGNEVYSFHIEDCAL